MPVHQFTYQEYLHENELDDSFSELLSVARSITQQAYAPYSNFFVAAAILLENGTIVKGVNIENASYPVGICAERSALSSAISQFPDQRIMAMAITYQSSGANNTPAFPCGMCRQFISECEDRNKEAIPLILAGKEGKIIVVNSSKDLLPFSFGGKDLK